MDQTTINSNTTNGSTTIIGSQPGPTGGGIQTWVLLLIAFCTLLLTAASVWVAAAVALR